MRRYKTGQPVMVRVELTANHRGYFEFRLCPNNAASQVASQACLDKHVLRRVRTRDADDTFHETRFYPGTENKVYEMRYSLPDGLTCKQCVLQWKYVAGNNWGVCENGTGAVGCGPQEEFRACADVSVTDKDGAADTSPYPTTTPVVPPVTTAKTKTSTTATTMTTTTTTKAVADDDDDDESVNEIPDADRTRKPDAAGSGLGAAVFVLSAVLLSLGFVLVVFAFVYWYFYHAGDTVKSWWRTVAAGSSSYFGIWKSGADEKKTAAGGGKNEQPVPPPRAKKSSASIGFKGVPDNLV